MVFERAPHQPLRILLADDDPATLELVGGFLEDEGHQVVAVASGDEALEQAEAQEFQLYILDVVMPGVSGLEVCRHLKATMKWWVPVVLVSANDQEHDQVIGMSMGAEHYVTKPISFPLLKAKVEAVQRLWSLYSDLQKKNAELEQFYNRSKADSDLAKDILSRITRAGKLQTQDSQHIVNPAEDFSGDIIVSLFSVSQRFYCLVGDATGHGLPAAITLMPAVDTFYRMGRDGYAVNSIAYQLNRRLRESLPRDRFLAATLIMVDPRERTLEIWNGGCPPAFLLDTSQEKVVERFLPRHPPLGMLEPEHFSNTTESTVFEENQHLVAFTDGIVEAEAPDGALFGVPRLKKLLEQQSDAQAIPDAVKSAIDEFTGEGGSRDDQTLLVLPLNSIQEGGASRESEGVVCEIFPRPERGAGEGETEQGWEFGIRLNGQTIRDTELIPLITHAFGELELSEKATERAQVCITELVNNAVDHGVLQLSSNLKEAQGGFEAYFNERNQRLGKLRTGEVRVRVSLEGQTGQRTLLVEVEDDGPGFDFERQLSCAFEDHSPCGRGIPMVSKLADRFTYENGGRKARFEIFLDGSPDEPATAQTKQGEEHHHG